MTIDYSKLSGFNEKHLRDIGVPKRYRGPLMSIETLTPGPASPSCKFVLDNLSELDAGNMLVLSGTIGCGKSFAGYLATMIFAAEKSRREREAYIRYEKGEETEMPATIEFVRPYSYARAVNSKEVLKQAFEPEWDELVTFRGLLMIDDLGYEHFTDKGFGIAEWDYLFDIRYSEELPTLITTNLTLDELVEKYNQRIYDRLKECATWYQFTGASLRKKISTLVVEAGEAGYST